MLAAYVESYSTRAEPTQWWNHCRRSIETKTEAKAPHGAAAGNRIRASARDPIHVSGEPRNLVCRCQNRSLSQGRPLGASNPRVEGGGHPQADRRGGMTAFLTIASELAITGVPKSV